MLCNKYGNKNYDTTHDMFVKYYKINTILCLENVETKNYLINI